MNFANLPMEQFLKLYRQKILDEHPEKIGSWPLMSFAISFNQYLYKWWNVVHIVDRIAGNRQYESGGELTQSIIWISRNKR